MRAETILVDGYNVIRSAPGLLAAERRSLASGREALLSQIRATFAGTAARIIVVFDGDGARESRVPLAGLARGQALFTARGASADAVIVRLATAMRAAGDEVTVVTRDSELRRLVSAHGATARPPDEFRTRLHEAPRDVARRARHRAGVRANLGLDADPDADPDDEPPAPDRRRGNPRKAPRNRNR